MKDKKVQMCIMCIQTYRVLLFQLFIKKKFFLRPKEGMHAQECMPTRSQ